MRALAYVSAGAAAAAVALVGVNRLELRASDAAGMYPRPANDARLDGMSLQAVQIVSRHGFRAPLRPLPNDQSEWMCDTERYVASRASDEEDNPLLYSARLIADPRHPQKLNGNCYAGQLMPAGRKQTRAVGRYLRSLYVSDVDEGDEEEGDNSSSSGTLVNAGAHSLLPHTLNPDLMYIRSTDCKRTIETAECILAGMYPAHRGHARPGKEPITIHMQDYRLENMYGRSTCKRLQLLKKLHRSRPEVKEAREALKTVHEELRTALGTEELSRSWAGLCNTLDCMVGSGMPLPNGVSEELVQKVHKASGWELAHWNFGTKEICGLSIGGFVRDMRKLLAAAAYGESEHRFMLFSGHDNTLSPMLCGLGIYDGNHPPMGSILVFELWTGAAGDQVVRVLFNGKVQRLPGKDTLVPFREFLDVLDELSPDLHEECRRIDDLELPE